MNLMPDIEKIAGDYVRTHAAIEALPGPPNVGGRLPGTTTFKKAWVKVTQLHAASHPALVDEHLLSYMIQFDCYSSDDPHQGQGEAAKLGWTTRAVLQSMQGKILQGAVITNVKTQIHQHNPDLAFEPPRERYIIVADITAHPA